MKKRWLSSTLILSLFLQSNPAWSLGSAQEFQAGNLPSAYFTSSPTTASAGHDGIYGLMPNGALREIVSPTGEWDGLRELDVSADGTRLYALQSNHWSGVHRLLVFDQTGVLRRTIDGFASTLQAMTVMDDGTIYLLHTPASGDSAKVLRVDPATGRVSVHFDFGEEWALRDMDHDENENLYFTGYASGKGGVSGVFKLTPDGVLSLHAPLAGCFGLGYHAESRTLWVTVNGAGVNSRVYSVDLAGTVEFYAPVLDYIQPSARGISYDSARRAPLITLLGPGKVGLLHSSGQFHSVAEVLVPVDVDVR